MGKRAAPATGPVATKRRVDPAFTEIQDALKTAGHLPDACRDMLAAMVPGSLTCMREERGEEQATVVQWMDDALMLKQAALANEASAAVAGLGQLGTAREQRLAEVEQAKAALQDRRDTVASKQDALAEATITMTVTKKLLAQRQEEQRVGDADIASQKKELQGLMAAYEEHFKAPLEAGEALHYLELQPYLSALDMEESFRISISSSCCMTKEKRGRFDELVLNALDKALLERAAKLKEEVATRSPGSEERQAAVLAAEEQLAAHRAQQDAASAANAAAQKDVELALAALAEAEKAVVNSDKELEAGSQRSEQLRLVQDGFEQGALTTFRTLRDRAAASAITASAGA